MKESSQEKDSKASESMEFLRNSRKISVAEVQRASGRTGGGGLGGLEPASLSPLGSKPQDWEE